MAEATRSRPIEYYNPRLLILGICFFWGMAIGFCLFFFAPPKQMADQNQNRNEEVAPARTTMTEIERRRLDTPDIAEVAPAPEAAAGQRPSLETFDLEPPVPAMSTEGGLTGRTAPALIPQSGAAVPQTPPRRRQPQMTAPPPIPDLMP